MNKRKFVVTVICVLLSLNLFKTKAQGITPEQAQCIGEELSDYVSIVTAVAGGGTVDVTEGDLGGLGIFTNLSSYDAVKYAESGKGNLVVLYNNFSSADRIPSRTVGRVHGEVTLDDNHINSIYTDITNWMDRWPAVDVWQGYNEPISKGSSWENVIAHDKEVIRAAKDKGKAVCVGNFKETVSSLNSTYITEISTEASGAPVFLCLHSHWNSSGMLSSEITRVRNLGNSIGLPVLVTVAGYDSAAGTSDSHGSGWKGNLDAETYKQQLIQFKNGVGASGVAVFSLGLGGSWGSYDVAPLLTQEQGEIVDPGTGTGYLKLLSPAFNMTNDISIAIANNMDKTIFNSLDGLAGNAYNYEGGASASAQVTNFVNSTGINRPVMITETGDLLSNETAFRQELQAMKAGRTTGGVTYLGASIFNIFGQNAEFMPPEWPYYYADYNDTQLKTMCGGSCSGLGANFAVHLTDGNYERTQNINGTFVVGLVDVGDPIQSGIAVAEYIESLPTGLIPIIRTGTALDTTGPTAVEYGTFLKTIDSYIEREAYALAGPNEPQSECWWEHSGRCYPEGCGVRPELRKEIPRTIMGQLSTSYHYYDENGVETTNELLEGASICMYQGGGSRGRLPYYIEGYEAGTVTEEDGQFVLDYMLRTAPQGIETNPEEYIFDYTSNDQRYTYMGILCGNQNISRVIEIDNYALANATEALPSRYKDVFESKGIDPDHNDQILAPIELTLLCDPDNTGASFPDDPNEECKYDPSDPHGLSQDCIRQEEKGFYGWDFAARNHLEGEGGSKDNKCPQYLPYIDRREQARIASGAGNPDNQMEINPQSTSIITEFDLSTTDTQYRGSRWRQIIDNWWTRFGIVKGPEQFEGKVTPQATGNPWPEILSNAIGGLLAPINLLGPREIPKNPEGDGLMDLYDCNLLRESNMTYSPGGRVNSQRQGMIALLAQPYSEAPSGLKYLYDTMDKDVDVCCLRDDPTKIYEPCEKNENMVTLAEIQAPRTLTDNFCKLVEDEDAESGWSPAPGETDCDGEILPPKYFPAWMVFRDPAAKSSMAFTRGDPKNDSIGTEYRRDKLTYIDDYYAPPAPEVDPVNDLPNPEREDCVEGARCGSVDADKVDQPSMKGANSAKVAKTLLDYEGLLTNPETEEPEQAAIGILEPYTGFEGKSYRKATASGHRVISSQLNFTTSILDGHNEFAKKIELVNKTSPSERDAERPIIDSGGAGASFTFLIKCEAGKCKEVTDRSAMEYYGDPFLNQIASTFNWFTNVISSFWVGEDNEQCATGGNSKMNEQNVEVDCEKGSPGCECTIVDEEEVCKREETRFDFRCAPNLTLDLEHNTDLTRTIDLSKATENLILTLEGFMLPLDYGMQANPGEIVDVQSDKQLTDNNESGFGGTGTDKERDPTFYVDYVKKITTPYTQTKPQERDEP